ncbi:MAG: hypothetical protein LUC93_11040 [Planctomycetaceae bacterium]|nr:hypothetical protein [Planctomycetaceae bacterium]
MVRWVWVILLLLTISLSAMGQEGDYDQLPLSFEEMDEYDQIAMEPYRDRYDTMLLAEKAKAYAVVFEFMRDRPPNYPPEVAGEVERYDAAANAESAYEAKQHLYKAPPPPRQSRPGITRSEGQLLKALPGPWEKAAEEEKEAERYQSGGLMESLRYGFNAIDRVRE